MAIKGFLPPQRFAKLGTIRLGTKATSGKGAEYPKDLPHFKVPMEVAEALHPVRQPNGETVMLPYGDEPNEIEVMLPTSDFDTFCPMELQRWDAAERLLCSGDGEMARRWSDSEGAMMEIECAYEDCPFFGKAKGQGCDEVGTLNVILPYVNTLGIYVINTHSRHGLRNVRDEFAAALAGVVNVCGNADMIRAVTFRLTRELKTVHYIEGGVRKPSEKYLLHLRPEPLTMPQARQLAATFGTNQGAPMLSSGETIALPQATNMPALPPMMEMPEPTEPECPKDLVAGASPVGPSLGQKTAFAALKEQVTAQCKRMAELVPDLKEKMEKRAANFESVLARAVNPDASRFEDLASETEAPKALELGGNQAAKWQEDLDAEEALSAQAQAAPEPEAEPEQETQAEPVQHGDPTAAAATQQARNKRAGENLGF